MAAATMVCWPLGTCARALRIQCPRQRCQLAPSTRVMAWRKPSWASEIARKTGRGQRAEEADIGVVILVAAFAPNASPRVRARRREKRSGYRLVRTLDLYPELLIGD